MHYLWVPFVLLALSIAVPLLLHVYKQYQLEKRIADGIEIINSPITFLEEKKKPVPFTIGPVTFTALGDRLIIVEDQFKSGYECLRCDGKCKIVCTDCGGSGFSPLNPEMICKTCQKEGTITCPECNGKGGTLITPDVAQRRPTTGKIVSAGPKVETLKVGDSVLYSNFAGYVIDIQNTVIRMLHEPEALSLVSGHLTVRRGTREMPDSFDSTNAMSADKGFK